MSKRHLLPSFWNSPLLTRREGGDPFSALQREVETLFDDSSLDAQPPKELEPIVSVLEDVAGLDAADRDVVCDTRSVEATRARHGASPDRGCRGYRSTRSLATPHSPDELVK